MADLKDYKRRKYKKTFRTIEPRIVNGRNILLGYLYWLNNEFDLAEEYFKLSLKNKLSLMLYLLLSY